VHVCSILLVNLFAGGQRCTPTGKIVSESQENLEKQVTVRVSHHAVLPRAAPSKKLAYLKSFGQSIFSQSTLGKIEIVIIVQVIGFFCHFFLFCVSDDLVRKATIIVGGA